MSLRPFTRSGWAGMRSLVRSINTAAASSTHVPVMLPQVLEFLKPKSGAVYCDATYGDGGYTRAILDQDPVAYDRAKEVAALEQYRTAQLEIDTPERGFSYKSDGPLDMRMFARGSDDQEPYVPKSITAYEVVNFYSRQQLADIIYQYGGDRLSRKIADAIVNARVNEPIKSTLALAQIVQAACPQPRWSRGGDDMVRNSAARTFQAIRIHINDELEQLRSALASTEDLLQVDGRLVVVTFHSLEDRMVKNFLHRCSGKRALEATDRPVNQFDLKRAAHRENSRRRKRHDEESDQQRFVYSDTNSGVHTENPSFALLNKHVVQAPLEEVEENSRSRSAKLRAARRTSAGPVRPFEQ
ncbi:hypothetical protein INT44_009077 [Umbelopsis vinacea]|uniref:Uncharacterized protein n=1 Tax=Umbelopsis vinacea TaxID=44442 RepID=A0A8H7Q0X9_9FUNG|nr:hypothetical protein INT44_009077 [Umbelopsis vinacea]